jgi:hypothetical protein
MRIFKRIIYAIAAGLGLATVIILTQQQVFSRVATELGGEAIENEAFEFFVSTRYFYKEPITIDTFEAGEYVFDIIIYNVANIRLVDDTFDVVEGFQIILHQKNEPLIDLPFSAIIKAEHEDIEIEYQGYQIGQLPVFVFIEVDERSTFFAERRFIINETFYLPTTIEILHLGQVINTYDLNLTIEDFKLKDLLNQYLNTHQEVPLEAFDEVGYAVIIEIDSTREVIQSSLIYLLIVAVITYLLFVFRRKQLGRSEATEGLKKDIEKLKNDEQ